MPRIGRLLAGFLLAYPVASYCVALEVSYHVSQGWEQVLRVPLSAVLMCLFIMPVALPFVVSFAVPVLLMAAWFRETSKLFYVFCGALVGFGATAAANITDLFDGSQIGKNMVLGGVVGGALGGRILWGCMFGNNRAGKLAEPIENERTSGDLQ